MRPTCTLAALAGLLALVVGPAGCATAQPDQLGPQVQPSSPPPGEPPPPPDQQPTAGAPAYPADPQADPSQGQWVFTQQYGWVWMPYGQSYTYVPPGGTGEPEVYVYSPSYGWGWAAAPWVWGVGPWPYFGARGPGAFFWYRSGWWRTPRRWHYAPERRLEAHERGFRPERPDREPPDRVRPGPGAERRPLPSGRGGGGDERRDPHRDERDRDRPRER